MLLNKLQKRLKQEESGFTLIELLIVLVIIGILLAIAVPSYLGFKDRANNSAAQANVRSAVPAVEAYYADVGTYAGMASDVRHRSGNRTGLQGIDAGIKLNALTRWQAVGHVVLHLVHRRQQDLVQGRPRGHHHHHGLLARGL